MAGPRRQEQEFRNRGGSGPKSAWDEDLKSDLRILQLISSGGFYGAENVVLQLTSALQRLNCQVVIGAFQNKHRPNTDVVKAAKRCGFETELFDCSGRFDLGTIRVIRETLQRRQIQILHAHGYKANFYGQLAVRGGSVKQVYTAHGWPGKNLSLRLYALVDRVLLRRADHVCVVSPSMEEQVKKFGVPSHKLSLTENGVDTRQFSSGTPVLRDLAGLDGKLIVGFVGRLAPEKGLRILIQAAEGILRAQPDVKLVLVGEGPEREELQTLVSQSGLEKSVIFLGQRSDLPDVYASFDIFVLPSLIEAMPMTVLEAMAAGKPIIASRVGGVPKMISDQESGILVEPGDVSDLKAALTQLLQRPETARQFGKRASEVVQARFSSDSMARRYLSVYQKVLSADGSPVNLSPTTTAVN